MRVIMRYSLSPLATIFILLMFKHARAIDWMAYDDSSSDVDVFYTDEADQYLSALIRADEEEIHSPIMTGNKYVSGGAGEGQQHLSPSGELPNHPEVKTDDALPAFCHPPNPCPLGFEDDDCDASSMSAFTAEYSRLYQSEQTCQCDKDHDQCSNSITINADPSTAGASSQNLKRSRRVGRDVHSTQRTKNTSANKSHRNSFHQGQTLRFHVAKKSPNTANL